MEEKIGVAIIGCGRISKSHLRALQKISYARIEAIVSRTLGKAKKYAREFGASKYYSSVDEALRNPLISAVFVLLPHNLHAKVSIDAMRAGKHVLVEKPLCNTSKEADQMIGIMEKTNTKLMPAMCYRYEPSYVKAKEIIDKGAIGDTVHIIELSLDLIPREHPEWWQEDEMCGGFVLPLLGSHVIDRIHWLGDDTTELVTSSCLRFNPKFDGESEVSAVLMSKKQRTTNMALSFSFHNKGHCYLYQTLVIGTLGTMRINRESPPWGRKEYNNNEKLESVIVGSRKAEIPELPHGTTIYELEDREFLSSIIEDRDPEITAWEGREVVRVIEAIRENSSKGWTKIHCK